MNRSKWVRVALVIWLLLVMAVSISPLSFKLKLHTTGGYHDFGHYCVYGLTGIILWLAADSWVGRIVTFLMGATLAFGQEWLENHMYHAGFEWKDVGSDLAGLVSGYALMLLFVALTSDERAAL